MNTRALQAKAIVLPFVFAAFGVFGRAPAQTFTYANSSTTYAQSASQSINLSTGSLDYVFYTYGGETQTDGASYITGGPSDFNPVLTFGSDTNSGGTTENSFGYNGPNAKYFTPHVVTYTGGYQYNYNLAGTATAVGNSGDNSNGGTKSLGFASVTPQSSVESTQSISSSILLNASEEFFTFYIEANSNSDEFTFNLLNSSNQIIATSSDNALSNPSGQDYYGTFTLDLAGVTAGDTLDWTETPGTIYNSAYDQVGIQGITESAVPEPATYAYLAFGLVGLAAILRFRKQSV